MVSVLVARADLFSELCTLFKEIDDIYVTERLLAAAFGACCIDPSRSRLESYSVKTFEFVFAERKIPLSILLRDYARGIIELAFAKSSLPAEVAIVNCRPPYDSTPANLKVSEATLKKVAVKAGDEAILHSCDSFMGDFATYEIKPRVGSFASVALKRPRPVSSRELYEKFETEVIDIDEHRVAAVRILRERNASGFSLRLSGLKGEETRDDAEELRKWAAEVTAAERSLLALLSPAEGKRYTKEAAHHFGISNARAVPDIPAIDIVSARRWVAKKAYDMGWTKKLFPNDSSGHSHHSRDRPFIERIGKKYQWIALDELLCRLADNCWIGEQYAGTSKVYDNPLDIGFERDIDPTVIPLSDDRNNCQGLRPYWVVGAEIEQELVSEDELAAWPFQTDPALALRELIHRNDQDGKSWVTLYEHRSMTRRYEDARPLHGLRQQVFHFVMCVIVAKTDRANLVDFLAKGKHLDVMEWDPLEFTDGPFLREAPWRDTWAQDQWRKDVWKAPKGVAISFPVCDYYWESHLDASLPEGARAFIPSPWLVRAMALAADHRDASIYRDAGSEIAFIGSKLGKDGSSALIAKDALERYLDANDLQCLWLFVGERNAWPGGDNGDAAWRRSEGICWLENGRPVVVSWRHDKVNGASRVALAKSILTESGRTEERPGKGHS